MANKIYFGTKNAVAGRVLRAYIGDTSGKAQLWFSSDATGDGHLHRYISNNDYYFDDEQSLDLHYYTSTCSCGQTKTASEEHDFTVTGTEATCTEAGKITKLCEKCSKTEITESAAIGHDYEAVTIAPTCTEEGYTAHTCSRCGDEDIDDIVDALGHISKEPVKENIVGVGCGQPGYYDSIVYCERCNKELSRETITVDAMPHNVVIDAAVSATCTTSGLTEGSHCSECGETFVSQEVIDPLGHNWSTEHKYCDNTYLNKCANCGLERTASSGYEQVDAPITHLKPVSYADTAATCTDRGQTGGSYCAACNAVIEEPSYTDALGHDWSEADCENPNVCKRCNLIEGVKLDHAFGTVVTDFGTAYTPCTRCGANYCDAHKLAHTYNIDNATCIEDKYCTRCLEVAESASGAHTPGAAATCTTAQKCTVCGIELSPANGHNYLITTVDATCTTDGYIKHECKNCDYEMTEHNGFATGHTEVIDEAVAADCTTTGLTQGKHCSVCNTVLVAQTTVPPKGHVFTTGFDGYYGNCQACGAPYCGTETGGHVPGPAATCTTAQICTACSTELEPAKGHTPGAAATCTTAQKCTICDVELAPATGHSYATTTVDATCTADGYIKHKCKNCSYEITEANGFALGHTYGNWYTTKAATCTTYGLERQDCVRCTDYKTRETSYADHISGVPQEENRVEPTCTKYGSYDSVIYCVKCGRELSRTPNGINPTGIHTPGTAATCTTAQTCAVCSTTLVAAKGHTKVVDKAVAATCTTAGLTEGEHCSVCGTITVAQTAVPAKGHSYPTDANGYKGNCVACGAAYCGTAIASHTEVTDKAVAATCTAAGITEGKHCSTCGTITKAQTTVPALGHGYIPVGTPATCTEKGYTTYTCERCGHSYVDNFVSATGHSFGSWYTTKNATCTEQGDQRRDCSKCDYYETQKINATGHGYVAVTTLPTCTAKGYTTYTCESCGNSYQDNFVAAKGHTEVTIAAVAPTCTATGLTAGKKCSVCNTVTAAQTTVAATGHNAGTAATCTTAQKCTVCNTTIQNALGHAFTAGIDGVYGTCTRGCGTYYCDDPSKNVEHDWQAADCENPKTCKRCGKTEGTANDHGYVAVTTAATCTKKGYTTYTCETCGDSYQDNFVTAKGHTPGAAATCTTAQKCTVCKTTITAALGHTPGAAATCTAPQLCTVCDVELAAALPHMYKNGYCKTCGTKEPASAG